VTSLTLDRLDCPPQFGTARDLSRPTTGAEVDMVHLMLHRNRQHPWQRYVADVSGELDPATGRRRYFTNIVVIPRQQGKTTHVQDHLTWSSRRAPNRTTVYAAQTRLDAKFKIIDEFADGVLASNPLLSARFRARRSNGSESIRWTDAAAARSLITIVATNDTAGHGLTKVDEVVLDEAWSHRDMTIVNSLVPTTAAAVDPQVGIFSTVGDGLDGLLQHYEEIGRASLLDPDTTVCFFMWCGDDTADRDNPADWARFMPSLGRSVSVERIRQFREMMGAAEFDRGFLNRRPRVADSSDLDAVAFVECAAIGVQPEPPLTVAVEISIDRLHTSIAVAGRTVVDGLDVLAVVIDRRPGTGWAVSALEQLYATRHVERFYADTRAGAGGIIADCAARGIHVEDVTTGDLVSYNGVTVDELAARGIRHADQPWLNDAVAGIKKRPIGDAFAWSKLASPNDVAPWCAASVAIGAHRRLFPPGVAVQRIG